MPSKPSKAKKSKSRSKSDSKNKSKSRSRESKVLDARDAKKKKSKRSKRDRESAEPPQNPQDPAVIEAQRKAAEEAEARKRAEKAAREALRAENEQAHKDIYTDYDNWFAQKHHEDGIDGYQDLEAVDIEKKAEDNPLRGFLEVLLSHEQNKRGLYSLVIILLYHIVLYINTYYKY